MTNAGAVGAARQHQLSLWQFESDPPAPTSPKQLQIEVVFGEWLDRWISERHYLGYCGPGSRLRLAVYFDGVIVGGMLWGRPVARALDQVRTMELTRMYLTDECPKNSESRCIAVATRIIRQRFPEVTTLIAYSDPKAGHDGTIYKAAGWEFAGMTEGRPWAQRPDGRKRKNRAVGSKMRWIKRL